MWSDYPITITLSSKDDNNSGRIGVTSITGDENGNITKSENNSLYGNHKGYSKHYSLCKTRRNSEALIEKI